MRKNYLNICCQFTCALLLGFCSQVWADEAVAVEPTVPEYQNAAQAAHDANLTEAYFSKIDEEMATLQDQIDAESQKPLDEQDLALIEQWTNEIDQLATNKGLIEDGQIAEMRADGMGWGDIAHALGVHPGALGLGHAKQTQKQQEMALATSTNLKTGYSTGHANAYKNGGPDKGNSSNKGNSNKEEKGNNKGGNSNNGNGGGNGNSGGNGNGGGNGKK